MGLLGTAALFACAHATAAEGGPDLAGYTWADSSSGGPEFNYEVDVDADPVDFGAEPDDSMTTVDFPSGFTFPFYGVDYSAIDIHSNGGLSFAAATHLSASHSCDTLSFEAPHILPYWTDLVPATDAGGEVYAWLGGEHPNRYFVVEWYEVPPYVQGTGGGGDNPVTFEAKLFETGRIEFHYDDLDGDGNDDDGADAVVLIAGFVPNSGNASMLVASCDSVAILSDDMAIGIEPPACTDIDNDGFRACDGDCDDEDESVYPGAPELCDGIDNDCNLLLPSDEVDLDQDGSFVCGGDCDDNDDQISGLDLDQDGYSTCTGDCDDSDPLATPVDLDGDGSTGCAGDCDDSDPAVSDEDADGDGLSGCAGDCNDHNNTVRPGNSELCDELDNDCDGEIDENPNCEEANEDTLPGHDIPYGCIVSCSLDSREGSETVPLMLFALLGLLSSRRRRGEG